MIIKSFTAESSAAALKMIREEMGGDAIVLKTRHVSDPVAGSRMEVTACLEKPSVAQSSILLSSREEKKLPAANETVNARSAQDTNSPKMRTGSGNRLAQAKVIVEANEPAQNPDLHASINAMDCKLDRLIELSGFDSGSHLFGTEFNSIANSLSRADFSRDFIISFIKSLEEDYPAGEEFRAAVHRRLVATLSEIMIPSLKIEAGDSLLFMGAAGAGKTSVMGKLAVRLVTREGMKVRLATLDDLKLAAHDELYSFAEFLGVEVAELDRSSKLDQTCKDQVTLVDTPALPTDPTQFEKLRTDIETLNPSHRFAVFTALTRTADTIDLARKMAALAPSHVIVSMLDLTRRYGSVIAAAEASNQKIVFVTDAPGGIGGANVPDPDSIARTVLNTEVAIEPVEAE